MLPVEAEPQAKIPESVAAVTDIALREDGIKNGEANISNTAAKSGSI